jgi:hypothetical protein
VSVRLWLKHNGDTKTFQSKLDVSEIGRYPYYLFTILYNVDYILVGGKICQEDHTWLREISIFVKVVGCVVAP